jgi:hypothetical protein
MPRTADTSVVAHASLTAVQNGPSSGSAAARRSDPKRTIVASGKTASSAFPAAASVSAARTRDRFTETSELTGIWHKAIRIPATVTQRGKHSAPEASGA